MRLIFLCLFLRCEGMRPEHFRIHQSGAGLRSIIPTSTRAGTKRAPSRKAGLSASYGGPGETRRKRRARTQCRPVAFVVQLQLCCLLLSTTRSRIKTVPFFTGGGYEKAHPHADLTDANPRSRSRGGRCLSLRSCFGVLPSYIGTGWCDHWPGIPGPWIRPWIWRWWLRPWIRKPWLRP